MKKIAVLGATGSIGTMCLDIVRRLPHAFSVVSLAAKTNIDLLVSQVQEFRPKIVSIGDSVRCAQLKEKLTNLCLDVQCVSGDEGLKAAIHQAQPDMVVSALSGADGLFPTLEAVKAGFTVGLANKESLVMGGELLSNLAKKTGAVILPIDSEHSAVFQCLQGNRAEDIKEIILTASGGPFREMSSDAFHTVTPSQALSHPTWDMGPKVTIDSATLFNKGLEVIEAHWLFQLPPEQIKVVVHPQSIIHSMVRYRDGSIISQLSCPDMRIPILYSLTYPERWAAALPELDLVDVGTLTFHAPDMAKFPCLALAYQALRSGGAAPIVLNRADQTAVHAFLEETIGFHQIPQVIEETLEKTDMIRIGSFDDIFEMDSMANEVSKSIVKKMRG